MNNKLIKREVSYRLRKKQELSFKIDSGYNLDVIHAGKFEIGIGQQLNPVFSGGLPGAIQKTHRLDIKQIAITVSQLAMMLRQRT